jgi:hypothetical protein
MPPDNKVLSMTTTGIATPALIAMATNNVAPGNIAAF